MKCRSCASCLLPVSAKISEACMPCRSSTVCVSNTLLPRVVVAAAASAWTAVERERCRRAVSVKSDEGLEELKVEDGRRCARASWRRSSVEAILVAGWNVGKRLCRRRLRRCSTLLGAKRTVLIRRCPAPPAWAGGAHGLVIRARRDMFGARWLRLDCDH